MFVRVRIYHEFMAFVEDMWSERHTGVLGPGFKRCMTSDARSWVVTLSEIPFIIYAAPGGIADFRSGRLHI